MSRDWIRPCCLDSTRKHRTGAAFSTERSSHCSSLLFGRWALRITARNCFSESLQATERSKSVLEHASFSFEATERSKSLLGHASFCFENTFEHVLFSFERTFDHACFSFEIPFEIALLRTVPCFELYFVRLHRHRKVPYANLVYIYIYIYIDIYIYIYI